MIHMPAVRKLVITHSMSTTDRGTPGPRGTACERVKNRAVPTLVASIRRITSRAPMNLHRPVLRRKNIEQAILIARSIGRLAQNAAAYACGNRKSKRNRYARTYETTVAPLYSENATTRRNEYAVSYTHTPARNSLESEPKPLPQTRTDQQMK